MKPHTVNSRHRGCFALDSGFDTAGTKLCHRWRRGASEAKETDEGFRPGLCTGDEPLRARRCSSFSKTRLLQTRLRRVGATQEIVSA
jgi:hypothetical protein